MLSEADNELLTQTGPGTPLGAVVRRYWVPALLAEELPVPDCPPVRVGLLGEELIAFRDSREPSGWSTPIARTEAHPSSSAATRRAASAACTTAGSSTSPAAASTCL